MPYWRLYYHLVWSTKNREPALHGSVADELERAIWQSAKQLELQIHALGVQPDHVHFAFSAPPRLWRQKSLNVSKVAPATTLACSSLGIGQDGKPNTASSDSVNSRFLGWSNTSINRKSTIERRTSG